MTLASVAVELERPGKSACALFADHFLDDAAIKNEVEWKAMGADLLEEAQKETEEKLGSDWIAMYVNPLLVLSGVRNIFTRESTVEQIRGIVSIIFLLGRGLEDRITKENKKEVYTNVITHLIDRNFFNYAALNPANESFAEQFGSICGKFLDKGVESNRPSANEPWIPG